MDTIIGLANNYIATYGLPMFIIQIAISLLGIPAIYLSQALQHNTRRWGSVLGVVSQPFWFALAYFTGAWGIGFMSIFYSAAWLKGLYNHWFKPPLASHEQLKVISDLIPQLTVTDLKKLNLYINRQLINEDN